MAVVKPLQLKANTLYTKTEARKWFGTQFDDAFAGKEIKADEVYGVNVGFRGQTLVDWASKNGFNVQLAPDGTAPRI